MNINNYKNCFQGTYGAYSHLASKSMIGAEIIPYKTFDSVFLKH